MKEATTAKVAPAFLGLLMRDLAEPLACSRCGEPVHPRDEWCSRCAGFGFRGAVGYERDRAEFFRHAAQADAATKEDA